MYLLDKLRKFITRLFQKQKRDTFEPIRLPCRILAVTSAFSRNFESTGVDLSLYEDEGIGHFFVTTTMSMQEYYGPFFNTKGFTQKEIDEQQFTAIIPGGVIERDIDGSWNWEFL